ncbi:hypothetical protein [Agrobacterium vaccinii]
MADHLSQFPTHYLSRYLV